MSDLNSLLAKVDALQQDRFGGRPDDRVIELRLDTRTIGSGGDHPAVLDELARILESLPGEK